MSIPYVRSTVLFYSGMAWCCAGVVLVTLLSAAQLTIDEWPCTISDLVRVDRGPSPEAQLYWACSLVGGLHIILSNIHVYPTVLSPEGRLMTSTWGMIRHLTLSSAYLMLIFMPLDRNHAVNNTAHHISVGVAIMGQPLTAMWLTRPQGLLKGDARPIRRLGAATLITFALSVLLFLVDATHGPLTNGWRIVCYVVGVACTIFLQLSILALDRLMHPVVVSPSASSPARIHSPIRRGRPQVHVPPAPRGAASVAMPASSQKSRTVEFSVV